MNTLYTINSEKDDVLMGSGLLYACEYDDFDISDIDVSDYTELGYIKDNAVFSREKESKTITTANYGDIDVVGGKHSTKFNTNLMSYKAENVAKFMTGSYVKTANGKKTTYFAEGDKSPLIALIFVGTDEDTNKEFMLVMPKCRWIGTYSLDFNNENPIALDFAYQCLNTYLGKDENNKDIYGAGFIVEDVVTPASNEQGNNQQTNNNNEQTNNNNNNEQTGQGG